MSRKSPKPRRAGRGAVIMIASMLALSAVLRIVAGPGEAVAKAMNSDTDGKAVSSASQMEQEQEGSQKADRREASDLLVALKAREERVAEQEKRLQARSKALELADAEITKRLTALEEMENRLRETLALASVAAEDDLARLTAVYESMKPKDAAALFATMEPDFAAGFLGRMRPDAAAAVMAGLPPDIAYSISAILAGRNARTPKS